MDCHQLDWCQGFDRLMAGRNFPGFRPGNPVLPSMGRVWYIYLHGWWIFYGVHVGKYTSSHGWYGVGRLVHQRWLGRSHVGSPLDAAALTLDFF